MTSENEVKRPQSIGEDWIKRQNGTKAQVNGNEEWPSSRDPIGHNDPYSGSDITDDEAERTRQYHRRIIRNNWVNEGAKMDKNKRNLERARFKVNSDGQNIIHRAILELQPSEQHPSGRTASPQALDYMEKIVLEQPQLFTSLDVQNKMPILEAAKYQSPLLFRVIDLLVSDATREETRSHCAQGMECPLWDVSDRRRKQCLRRGGDGHAEHTTNGLQSEKKIMFATPLEDSNGQPEDNETRCLHDDIDVDMLLREDQKLRDALKNALGVEQHARQCLSSLITDAKFDPGQETPQLLNVDSLKSILDLCPNSVFSRAPIDGFSPLQTAVGLFDSVSIDFKLLFDVVKCLVDRCPESIFLTTRIHGHDKTAYRLLKELGEKNPKEMGANWRHETEYFLKKICIGYRNVDTDLSTESFDSNGIWARKTDVLYWDAKMEKRFFLNFTGESVILDKTYINTIQGKAGMSIESVLDFVKLPYWKPAGARPHRPKLSKATNPEIEKASDIGSDPYVNIFDWLWAVCKVRKIFTIDVDDDGPEPHTNATIRESFRGREINGKYHRDFGIEIWKWKKFDLCSATIVAAAPAAREVYLYTYGNTAILRSWACEEGLARLTQLEKVFVEIRPKNRSDEQDCRDYEEEFKRDLVRNCRNIAPQNIIINNHGFGLGKSGAIDNAREGSSDKTAGQSANKKMPRSKEWIEELKPFKDFLINLKLSGKPQVRVAILDDGAKLADLNGLQMGKSFNMKNEDYFVGPCEHGTQMAICVREICPMAVLYIARLDNSNLRDNQAFTISSCHKALQWALEMEVDVISMSWTYERKATSDTDKQKFEELVKRIADAKKPILFGSLPDLGPNFDLHSFVPAGLEGVIKISSATVSGEVSAENIHTNSDFLLPGEEYQSNTGKIVRGSSFATAYAAGLAALVLYALGSYNSLRDEIDAEEASKALSVAQRIDGMKSIFRVLGQGDTLANEKRGPFLRPVLTFRRPYANDATGEKRDLRQIVHELVTPEILRKTYI